MNEMLTAARAAQVEAPAPHHAPTQAGEGRAGVSRTGMRLHRCEFFNWGTFHGRVWGLELNGDNTLLTGDIGSGKSTLVDAITTLLVPAQKISYNKAAGADARERDLRSYVLGHYKSERGESGFVAKPVALRDVNTYSVILGRFRNDGFQQDVTLAQVFSFKEAHGQPTRFYVVADMPLTISEHFSGFGSDINALKKKLRLMPRVEVHDTFPPYSASFRRRFGIENEQALDLFHQTVSMKSVGNLTEFVRQHMLEAFPVETRIDALMAHFDNLNRAHESVLKAKAQIERLSPLIADCDHHSALMDEAIAMRGCRDALRTFFAGAKAGLLERRCESLESELERLGQRIAGLDDKESSQRLQRDEIKRAIAENGGDRIESLKREIAGRESLKAERMGRAEKYAELARAAGLAGVSDADAFAANRAAVASGSEAIEAQKAETQNAVTEESVALRQLRTQHAEIAGEIESLKKRRSNIPANMLAIRDSLCRELKVDDESFPFIGELIQVREEEAAWEAAIERVLHNYALSLLVPDEDYAQAAEWVERTHLGGRLVYYRVRARHAARPSDLHARSLVRKLSIRPDSAFYAWLDADLARRFDYACCDTIDSFRREDTALTRAGQIKSRGERHEKDDRHRLDDRTRYVLGWSNESKIAALEDQARALEARIAACGAKLSQLQRLQNDLDRRACDFAALYVFESFRDLDWQPLAAEIDALEAERRQLEAGSDVLRTLQAQLAAVEQSIAATKAELAKANEDKARASERADIARRQLDECRTLAAASDKDANARYFRRLEEMLNDGERRMTVETCDSRERELRDRLQDRIDKEDQKISRLREKIVAAMTAYNGLYQAQTREVDASIESAPDYRKMLSDLEADGLPRFEARFKELLNENTIREIANFQSQLHLERQSIKERIEKINQSLHEIDYNPGRFIVLEDDHNGDSEIRSFQQDLRSCTEGTLTGSEDIQYSEAKFLQVKAIIERFRGREGMTELDRRWTRKVTDVRNWFAFSASERWREDNSEHEHYTDSGGKSGGQKEKLAYTVLAASLAYQFGLEWGETRSRSFRFVLIDEAFGRGSDESTRYGLELFRRLSLQLLIVTPLQKIHVIEPFVAAVGFVHNDEGSRSMLRNLTIEEYRAERLSRAG
ncbi:MAG TPA: SbcC/MukB-like Walker B domain-containing protein [Xanthobacteraceae bacterium]|nr:SbcC/MukB-like Walker B domain-containing protein [Xanthobacteraceae bacterium]